MQWGKWMEMAINDELDALNKNETWTVTTLIFFLEKE